MGNRSDDGYTTNSCDIVPVPLAEYAGKNAHMHPVEGHAGTRTDRQALHGVAVAHVETERGEPPVLNAAQMHRFIDVLAALAGDVPHEVLQIDFEALSSQRAFFIEAPRCGACAKRWFILAASRCFPRRTSSPGDPDALKRRRR